MGAGTCLIDPIRRFGSVIQKKNVLPAGAYYLDDAGIRDAYLLERLNAPGPHAQ